MMKNVLKSLTPRLTGWEKPNDEGARLFPVRVQPLVMWHFLVDNGM